MFLTISRSSDKSFPAYCFICRCVRHNYLFVIQDDLIFVKVCQILLKLRVIS